MSEEIRTPPSGEAPPLSGMLEGLLSNPEMLSRIGAIVSSMSASSASTTDVQKREESAPVSAPFPNAPAPDGLASLLSDPSFMEKLPQMMSMLRPLLASMPSPTPAPTASRSPADCRNNLLLALKPFLSPERCAAVDSILRISKLGTVFQQLK